MGILGGLPIRKECENTGRDLCRRLVGRNRKEFRKQIKSFNTKFIPQDHPTDAREIACVSVWSVCLVCLSGVSLPGRFPGAQDAQALRFSMRERVSCGDRKVASRAQGGRKEAARRPQGGRKEAAGKPQGGRREAARIESWKSQPRLVTYIPYNIVTRDPF